MLRTVTDGAVKWMVKLSPPFILCTASEAFCQPSWAGFYCIFVVTSCSMWFSVCTRNPSLQRHNQPTVSNVSSESVRAFPFKSCKPQNTEKLHRGWNMRKTSCQEGRCQVSIGTSNTQWPPELGVSSMLFLVFFNLLFVFYLNIILNTKRVLKNQLIHWICIYCQPWTILYMKACIL